MSWLARLRQGLSKTSNSLGKNLTSIFNGKRVDEQTLDDLLDTLIATDMSVSTASKLVERVRATRFAKETTSDEIRQFLAVEIAALLTPVTKSLMLRNRNKGHTVLMVGVNGSGKTTTIGKLAAQAQEEGLKAAVIAGDTFRAGATEQLRVWAERTKANFFHAEKGDAAALFFDTLQQHQSEYDVLFFDTAGRLHNKDTLMEELSKIIRVMRKIDATSPHECILVLDGTTGSAALNQVKLFQESAPLTGLIITKLDGTAKGGMLVTLADTFKLPIYAIGVGESVDDLQAFTAKDFAESLLGL
jgi:fused signal recognition particle receptor